MALLEQGGGETIFVVSPAVGELDEQGARHSLDERAARRSLRQQIARLERELADAFLTAYRLGGIELPSAERGQPRLLDLGELERVRDELAERLRAARVVIAGRAEAQNANRLLLERMLLEPHEHRFVRIAARDLGEPGCGVWQVRPRRGLIGMLMGWWEVRLSSGCPITRGRGELPAARASDYKIPTERRLRCGFGTERRLRCGFDSKRRVH
jgi:hypothetical protein